MNLLGWVALVITLAPLVIIWVVPSGLHSRTLILAASYLGAAVVMALLMPLLTGEYYQPGDIMGTGPDGRLSLDTKGEVHAQIGAVVIRHLGFALIISMLVAWWAAKPKRKGLTFAAALLLPLLPEFIFRYWWWYCWFYAMVTFVFAPITAPGGLSYWQSTWDMWRLALTYLGPSLAAGIALTIVLLLQQRKIKIVDPQMK